MARFRTRLTELFGIDHPIIMGGMQWLGTAELAGAVSEAGGLGIICGRTFPDGPSLRLEIQRVRAATSRPIGVNLTTTRRQTTEIEGYVDVIIEEAVPIVETAGDNPEPYIRKLKSHGIKVMHKVTSVRHARKAEDLGADAVAVVGFESAGLLGRGEVGVMALLPSVVGAVQIPVAGTGGADGRGLLAVLSLGAEALLMGTRFMATEECRAHPVIKQAIIEASEASTMVLHRGQNDRRVLRTPFAQRVLEMEKTGVPEGEILPLVAGQRSRAALIDGDMDAGVFTVGQSAGLIDRVMPARLVIEEVVAGAAEGLDRLVASRF